MVRNNPNPILIRGARQLITLRGAKGPRRGTELGDLGIIPDGAVLIRNGVLQEVGPTRRLENLVEARQAQTIDATGCVVMPGLVDAHTHLVYPAAASSAVQPSAPAMRVNTSSVKRHEMRARPYVDAMARHGTTTSSASTGCVSDKAAEIKLLRVLGSLDGSPLEIVPECLASLEDAATPLAPFADLLEILRRRHLAAFIDIDWPAEAQLQAPIAELARVAREAGFRLKFHQPEASESGVRVAVANEAVSISHLDSATASDVEALAGSDTIVTLVPATGFQAGQGRYAPARALIDAGAAVALGSNFNPSHTPLWSMQAVIALACSQMHMTAAEAIVAATVNAAYAIGRGQRQGTLEIGRNADLVMFDMQDYHDLADHFGANLAALTIKRGRIIYRQAPVILERAG